MIIVELVDEISFNVKMSAYDFECEFNNALKEKKIIKVVAGDGTVYLNPYNIITFSESKDK